MISGIHVFPTPIGHCGIAWNGAGIVRIELPCGSAAKTKARMMRLVPQGVVVHNPPASITQTIVRIQRHINGACDDMTDIPVNFSGFTAFSSTVYRALRKVRPGMTVTYGELARRIGCPGAARAVGRAMATNPVPLIVPCHRVIASDGTLGGFSGCGGARMKERLLTLEKGNPGA